MKFIIVAIALCAAICVANSTKLLSSSRQETNIFRRLLKRQAYNDPNCNRRACAVPNCGKDFIAATLPGECCERCVPWEYAQSLGLRPAPQPQQDNRNYDPYNQQNRADVYIYGPDEGARVSAGQSIYFDCEVTASYNQYAQPRWSRAGNQQLPYKAQSTTLPGNRKLARLTIPDATHSDGGRYECSAGTGNPSEVATIDLQVTEGGYYPRPQPQPQQPSYNYDPYNQYPYNQPGYPQQPQPGYPQQPQPGYPQQPQPGYPQQPQPNDNNQANDEDNEDNAEFEDDEEANDEAPTPATAASTKPTAAPPSNAQDEEPEDEGEYPEDYSENE